MLLVPANAFPRNLDPYTMKKISTLDQKMEHILRRQDLDKYNKAKLYHEILNEYLEFQKDMKQPIPIQMLESKPQPQEQPAPLPQPTSLAPPIVEETLKTIPRTLKSKAERLATAMQKIPDLSWNDKGEMTLKGQLYRGSHYTDLLNDILRARKDSNPIGWEALTKELGKINVPQELIGNKERKQYIRNMKTSTPPSHHRLAAAFPNLDITPETPPPSKRKAHTRRYTDNATVRSAHVNLGDKWDFSQL